MRRQPEREDKDGWEKPQVACRKQSLPEKTESGLRKTSLPIKNRKPLILEKSRACGV